MYISKGKLLALINREGVKANEDLLNFFVTRDEIIVSHENHIEGFRDEAILAVLDALVQDTKKRFGILLDIIHHNDDSIMKLENERDSYKAKLAKVAKLCEDIKSECSQPPQTAVVKIPVTPKPVVSVPVKPIAKNAVGNGVGKTPTVINKNELDGKGILMYDHIMRRTKEMFQTNGNATGIVIYNLMGAELVQKLGLRYAKEHDKKSHRTTTLTAPILAAYYRDDEEVKKALEGVI